jgi:hypothetical protein
VDKVTWTGHIFSVQPRIRLTRSFDERGHSYLGYCLYLEGIIGDESRPFSVGIGPATQQKHQFQVGDEVSGESVPVADKRREPVETYRARKLRVWQRNTDIGTRVLECQSGLVSGAVLGYNGSGGGDGGCGTG